jgi:hypothetical protein
MLKAFEQLCTVVEAEKGKKKRLKCNFCIEVFPVITRIVVHLSGAKGKKGAEAAACMTCGMQCGRRGILLSYNTYRTTTLNKVNMRAFGKPTGMGNA